LDSLGSVQKKTFTTLSVRGLDIPFKVKFVPPEAFYKPVDGSSRTNYQGFQRIIQVELGAINSDEDFIRAFFQAATKSFAYQGSNIVAEEVQVVYESPSFEDTWFDNFKYTKKYVFELTENIIRTEWSIPKQPEDNLGFIYLKSKVVIAGIQGSPEIFTTNSGKLSTDAWGNTYPNISLLSHKVTVITVPYQSGKINQTDIISQAGSNISFPLAHSDSENPSDDGFWYADIIILGQDPAA
jgi:hypothetical protein